MTTLWTLSAPDIVEVNRRVCERDNHRHQCHDIGKVESALHSAFYPGEPPFVHGGIATIAGALAFYITQAHAFFDGNKRTAVTAALVFMNENGWTLQYPFEPIDTLADLIERCASSTVDCDAVKEWFALHKLEIASH